MIPANQSQLNRQLEPRKSPCQRKPVLRFSPTAWAKLQWFCHHGETEIGGFGITPGSDLLLVEDFLTVRQEVSIASVSFDDAAVADFFDRQVDAGRKPHQFARIWLHTHPGSSANPSATDEETFSRVFGSCDWAVMFIFARGGKSYARLRFGVGPGGEVQIPVEVDYSVEFAGSRHEQWDLEYTANVQPQLLLPDISWPGEPLHDAPSVKVSTQAADNNDHWFGSSPEGPYEPDWAEHADILDPWEWDQFALYDRGESEAVP